MTTGAEQLPLDWQEPADWTDDEARAKAPHYAAVNWRGLPPGKRASLTDAGKARAFAAEYAWIGIDYTWREKHVRIPAEVFVAAYCEEFLRLWRREGKASRTPPLA